MVKIPEGWIETTLKSVCVKAEDKINVSDLTNETYISTENMLVDKGGITTATTLPTITNVSKFFPGDILFSNIRTYFKKLYLSNFTGGCSNDVLIFRANKETDNKFLFYNLSQDTFFDYTVKTSKGTKMPRGDKNAIEKFGILLPPLPEQLAIASVLSSFDDKIELLREENQTLEEMGQTLFKEWFGKYKVGDELPDGWEIGKLGEEFDISIGRTPPRAESEWFSTNSKDKKRISIKDMVNSGPYIFSTSEYLTKEAVNKFNIPRIPENTTILSFKMTVGKLAITTEEMLSNEAIAHLKIKNNSKLYSEFIYLYLQNLDFNTLGSTSSIVTAINSTIIKEMNFVIPDNDTLSEFSKIIKPIFKKIKTNSEEIQTLSNTRDQLLPKLMSGEVRVEF